LDLEKQAPQRVAEALTPSKIYPNLHRHLRFFCQKIRSLCDRNLPVPISAVFCYRSSVPRAIDSMLRDAVSLITGEQAVPWEIAARLCRRFALVGVASVTRMALSAIDTAIWDALAAPVPTVNHIRPY
jgi:hypothetical protein